jgi:hypothetical protein
MKRLGLLLASLGFIALFSLAPVTAATTSVTIPLSEQNGSGEKGTAKISDASGGISVTISLTGAPATAQPAHIHYGVCSDLGGVWYPLNDVVNGSSTTIVKGTSTAALLAQTSAINVHQSASDLGKYVACGDITAPQ